MREKDYIWNPSTCNCESKKYLASITDDSVITCDEIIELYDKETKTFSTNFKAICKKQSFYILLAFLLITIALLLSVNIYCYLIKYQAKPETFITTSSHKQQIKRNYVIKNE